MQHQFVQTDMAYYMEIWGIAGGNAGTIRYCGLTETYRGRQIIRRMPEYNPNTDFRDERFP